MSARCGGPPHVEAANVGGLLQPLYEHATAAPSRLALHADGRAISYGKLWSRVERVAAHLVLDWGIGKGDRVATLCFNHDLQLALLFACARIGAIFVPMNFRLAPAELIGVATHAGVRAIFHDDAHATVAAQVASVASAGIAAPAPRSFTAVLPSPLGRGAGGEGAPAVQCAHIDCLIDNPAGTMPEPGPMPADTPVLLVYTSGTTGRPKGAVHTQAALLANARASWWAHGMTAADHVLSSLPLFHVGGLCIQTLPALLAGAEVTLHDRFTAEGWLESVAHARPSLSLMVPATMRAVLEHPRWYDTDLSSLRGVMAGSSTIPLAYLEAFHRRGIPVGQVYGATETGPVSVVLRFEDAMSRPGQVGWPQPEAEVRLVSRNGEDAGEGEVGEIWLRGPNLMRGYWREAGALGEAWFRSGDLARRDTDGCLTVIGRSKDMIISGGENIYPAEIENAVVTLPGVAECAVVGLPDPRWGEVPVLAIVPGPGVDPATLSLESIRAALDGRIARFKLPRGVVLLPSLPKSALGKVQKPQLRAMLSSGPPDAASPARV